MPDIGTPWQCKRCGSAERYADGACAPCKRAEAHTRRAGNLEHYRRLDVAKARARRADNPEKSKAVADMWRKANAEKILAQNRARYPDTKDKKNKQRNARRLHLKINNPEKLKAQNTTKNAATRAKRSADPGIRAREAAYREANREKIKIIVEDWLNRNAEKMKKYHQAYRDASDKEAKRQYNKEYTENNRYRLREAAIYHSRRKQGRKNLARLSAFLDEITTQQPESNE